MARSIVILWIGLCLSTIQAYAYSGGTGEPNDPYQIAMAEDLVALGNEPNDYDKNFILTADIDLSGYLFDRAVIAPDTDESSSGFQGPSFSGFFAGQGHIIVGLQIEGYNYLGLFGSCTSEATIIQVGLEAVAITGTKSYVGGLVGDHSGILISSFSTGAIIAYNYAGGLVGKNQGTISSCYSTATVAGSRSSGGLVGNNDHGTITSSYSTGAISGIKVDGRLTPVGGGFVGTNDEGIVSSSFWDIESSGQSESAGGMGLTTADMQMVETYVLACWDLVGENAYGTWDLWMVQEDAYPSLAVFPGSNPADPNGFGTQENPYLLTNANELGTVWSRPWACYRLEADIDLAGITWNSAVVPIFMGVFDGNDHTISHLSIQGDSHLGLFGHCRPKATLTHLTLKAVDVNGTESYIAGLIGYNEGTISSCSISGTVCGDDGIGGLVGWNAGLIISGHSTATVSGIGGQNDDSSSTWRWDSGNDCVGGLVGYNIGSITSSTYSGNVSGDNYVGLYDYDVVGGLVGYNLGSITSSSSSATTYGDDSDSGLLNDFVGGLVGYNENATISGCNHTGTVNGIDYVGGLVGYAEGEGLISSCDNSGTIRGGSYVGGLVGYNDHECQITSCKNTGTVAQGYSSGGIAGENWGSITSSDNSGAVLGGRFVGGLTGFNKGSISSCHSIGDVNGVIYVGGLTGTNTGSVISSYSSGNVYCKYSPYMWYESTVGGFVGSNGGTITSSYYTGNVTGYDITSGFVGENSGSITSSYSIGAVKNNYSPEMYMGEGPSGWGFAAFNSGLITSSFWDTQTAEGDQSAGGIGLTTAEMKDPNTYLDAGWDFTCETANGPNDVWTMLDDDYPHLTWELDEAPLCPIEAVEFSSRNFYSRIAEGVVLVDFYATWCSHCDTQAPIMDEVATQVQEVATVGKVDIDQMEGIIDTYSITGVPTLILFNNAVEINRFVGVTQATVLVEAILAAVEE